MYSTQISELNCVPNFEASSFTETTEDKLILLDSDRKVYPCDVSLSNRSEDTWDKLSNGRVEKQHEREMLKS